MSEKKEEILIGLGGVKEAMEANRHLKELWAMFLQMVGVEEEAGDRLTVLLILHLMLDRAITELLAWQFTRAPSFFENIEAALANLPISKRIDLLKASGLLSDAIIGDIRAFNRIRNQFAHSDPKHRYKLKHVKELSSAKAFHQFVKKGLSATNEIRATLGESLAEHSRLFPDQSDSTPH